MQCCLPEYFSGAAVFEGDADNLSDAGTVSFLIVGSLHVQEMIDEPATSEKDCWGQSICLA